MNIFLKTFTIAICCIAAIAETYSQELFQKDYDYANRNDRVRLQLPSTIIQTQDSGFATITAAVKVPGQHPNVNAALFLKTDKSGEVQWSKYLRTIDDYEQVLLYSTIQAHDGSYYISGRLTVDQKYQPFLLKTTKEGEKLWMKTYSAPSGISIIFRTLAETSDHTILLAGADMLTAVDTSGNCLWAKKYSVGCNVIKPDSDSTFILTGRGLTQIDKNGIVLWAKEYDFWAGALYVHPLKTGGYTIVTNRGAVVSRTDNRGNILWSKSYQFVQLFPAVIDELPSGNIIVAGTYGTPAEGQYGWITILDTLGIIQKATIINRPGGGNIFGGTTTIDGNFVVESSFTKITNEQSASLIKISDKGNTSCPEKERSFLFTIEDYIPTVTTPTITDTLVSITASEQLSQYMTVDIVATDICASTGVEEYQIKKYRLFPNPATGICTIEINEPVNRADVAILDMEGRVLYRNMYKDVGERITLDISPLPSGVYFIKVNDSFVQKLVIE